MSTNLQWKNFQPSRASGNQDILDIPQGKLTMRNGVDYLKDYSNSGNGSRLSMNNYANDCSGDSVNAFDSSSNNSSQYDPPNHPNRETGIIEKLLHSYGFIQCCERQARLFFHFSQFSGNIEHLKIGDPVEFEMTYDRRTGKPIASTVTKIAPEVVLSEARVTGTVTTELRRDGFDTTGRISYENRGECFFLPYTKDDVEGNVTLSSGDAVSFQIATNQRGNLGACHIRLENPAHPVKYQGVVCSMKESFGFIERADVVKEIFFHFSETKTRNNLYLGDDVEFIIQTRNGKEVACNITRLPSGTVVFEDVSPEITRGQVLKPLVDRGNAPVRHQNDPLPGRIRYRAPDHSEVDVPFGDKDQNGEFTLRHGDWVQFQVATDRRDQLKRATNISLLDESFHVSGERRERGVFSELKNDFGYIACVERDSHVFFHFSEVLSFGQALNVGDEVEFTVDPATGFSNSRPSAIRIKHLPPGTVQFEVVLEKDVSGVITKEPSFTASNYQSQEGAGLIAYQSNGSRKCIAFSVKDVIGKCSAREGNKVVFNICQVKRTKQLVAMNVQVQHSQSADSKTNNSLLRPMYQGFIAALKDGYGFIETIEHDREIFFHFSNFQGSNDSLELGKEVEYALGRQLPNSSGGCSNAELVRLLPKGSIPLPQAQGQLLLGYVTRTIRALNPDQQEYSGLIEGCNEGTYEFSITSLACKREVLHVGDPVTFQVDAENRATNVTSNRKKRRATVDFIHGTETYGFLSFEIDEGKKLIFYMSEVRGPPNSLLQGDTVEFVLVINPRTGKSSACNVTKISGFDDMENGKDDYYNKHTGYHDSFDTFSVSGYNHRSHDYQYQGNKSFKTYNTEYNFASSDFNNGSSFEYKSQRNFDSSYNDRNGSHITRKKRRATIESIKGAYGFLSNEVEDNKKMVFHMTEVRSSPASLQPGDTVEYTLVTNQRSGKSSAINVIKISDPVSTTRPERLISRLRTTSLDENGGPRLTIIREPRGPDGTRGFRPRTQCKLELCMTFIYMFPTF